MTTQWERFATAIGATFADSRLRCSEQNLETQLQQSAIAPLSHYGFLAVEGPDAQTFLQGQTTCDLREVTDEHSRLGAYCTAKGRMVANFRIARRSEELHLLRMRREIVDITKSKLSKYIVFSKAELRDDSDQLMAFGLWGPKAQQAVADLFADKPEAKNGVVASQEAIAIQLDDQGQQFELWCDYSQALSLWERCCETVTPADTSAWELLMIRAGEAELTSAAVEEHIPQVLNFELIGGISFQKGCYTGQEVVARMHYLGKSKRRLYRATAAATEIAVNAPIHAAGKEQSIGNVVNSIALDDSSSELLAVITTAAAEEGVELQNPFSKLQLQPLPYSIDE